jgi:hypothetical protein
VVVRRGVPSTLNTPALDPVLMADGRAPDLVAQAHGAIMDHAQAPAPASDTDLARTAEVQRTEAFFSSPAMVEASFFGRPPALPQGTTPAERRGRDFFVDQPIGPNLEGVCAACHSGPMLNRTNQHLAVVNPGLVAGLRFLDLGLSDLNLPGYPVHDFIITLPDRTERSITSPDLGRLFISGNPIQVNSFKIPTLWGVAGLAQAQRTRPSGGRNCQANGEVLAPRSRRNAAPRPRALLWPRGDRARNPAFFAGGRPAQRV